VAGAGGPILGHNAIIRLQPFVDHCVLPHLPGSGPLGGQVLSHDQVEAAMMRGAGYDVRVIADEFESWRKTHPTCRISSSATCAGARATCNI